LGVFDVEPEVGFHVHQEFFGAGSVSVEGGGRLPRIFPSDPVVWVTGNASWKSSSSSSLSPPFGCSGSSSGGPPRFIALSMRALRLLLWGCFPLPDPSPWVSVCTSTLVLVPILISVGMGAVWRFSGSNMESGEAGRSSISTFPGGCFFGYLFFDVGASCS
jgi:hypothetical protein